MASCVLAMSASPGIRMEIPFLAEHISYDLSAGSPTARFSFDIVLYNRSGVPQELVLGHRAGIDPRSFRVDRFMPSNGADAGQVAEVYRQAEAEDPESAPMRFIDDDHIQVLRRGFDPREKLNWIHADLLLDDEIAKLNESQRPLEPFLADGEIPPFTRIKIGDLPKKSYLAFRISFSVSGMSFYLLASGSSARMARKQEQGEAELGYFPIYGVRHIVRDIRSEDLPRTPRAYREQFEQVLVREVLPSIIVPRAYHIILPKSPHYHVELANAKSNDVSMRKGALVDDATAYWLTTSDPAAFHFSVDLTKKLPVPEDMMRALSAIVP